MPVSTASLDGLEAIPDIPVPLNPEMLGGRPLAGDAEEVADRQSCNTDHWNDDEARAWDSAPSSLLEREIDRELQATTTHASGELPSILRTKNVAASRAFLTISEHEVSEGDPVLTATGSRASVGSAGSRGKSRSEAGNSGTGDVRSMDGSQRGAWQEGFPGEEEGGSRHADSRTGKGGSGGGDGGGPGGGGSGGSFASGDEDWAKEGHEKGQGMEGENEGSFASRADEDGIEDGGFLDREEENLLAHQRQEEQRMQVRRTFFVCLEVYFGRRREV